MGVAEGEGGSATPIVPPSILKPLWSVARRGDDDWSHIAMKREVYWRAGRVTVGDFLVTAPAVEISRIQGPDRIQPTRLPGDGDVATDDVDLHVIQPRLTRSTQHETVREANGGARNVEDDLLLRPISGEHQRPVLHEVGTLHDAFTIDAHKEHGRAFIHANRLEVSSEPHALAAEPVGANALGEHRRAARRFDIGFDHRPG